MDEIEYLLLKYLDEGELPMTLDKFPLYAITHSRHGLQSFNQEQSVQRLLKSGCIEKNPENSHYTIIKEGRHALAMEKAIRNKIEKPDYNVPKRPNIIKPFSLTLVFLSIIVLIAVIFLVRKLL